MKKDNRPNIVFFFSDQQRWDTVGCYGQKFDITPNLDKMALRGVKFENAFTCQPVCGPARASLQTGKYPTETGCFRNDISLPINQKTIAHYFNDSGYETAYVGKWHLASTGNEYDFKTKPIPPERRGGYRDYWMASDVLEFTSHGYDGYVYDKNMNKVEFKGYRTDCITDFALDYIRKKKDKPFFLFISHIEPHHQNDRNRYEGPIGSKEKYANYEVPGDLMGVDGDWEENYPDYLGCCARLDYNLGRVLDELDNQHIAENTIVFYTSDHGSHFKTRNKELTGGYDDYKRTCHESAIRIPMIVCGPGFSGGKVIDELVSLIDIPPTLLRCAGLDYIGNMHGRALQGLVEGQLQDWPQEVFIQISESKVGRAIRTKKWKYSVVAPHKNPWNDPGSDTYFEEYLYNLEKDPYEKNNLINCIEYKFVKNELKEILKRRMVEAGENIPEIISCL